jgi:hypothetical protein
MQLFGTKVQNAASIELFLLLPILHFQIHVNGTAHKLRNGSTRFLRQCLKVRELGAPEEERCSLHGIHGSMSAYTDTTLINDRIRA